MKNLRLLFFALFLGCFVPVLSYAQGAFIPARTVLGTVNGITRPLPGATVTVCGPNISGSPCAPALTNTVFKDSALTIPLANPFTTDANGNYPQAALAAGIYTITETASGFTGFSYQMTVSCSTTGACTVSGPFTVNGAATVTGALTAGSGNVTGALTAGSATISGAMTACSINGAFVAGSSCYPTIAAAYAACPAAPAACKLATNGNITPTAGLTINGLSQPVTLECLGSDQNGGGNTITFAAASAPATLFTVSNTATKFIVKGCTITERNASISSITGNGTTATVTLTGTTPAWITTNAFVEIFVNANSGFNTVAKVTGTGASTFTFLSSVNATGAGGSVSLAGPLITLTQVAGNGTTATGTCTAACGFPAGTYPVVIFGNSQAFNGVWQITSTGPSATTFTFPSPVNATNSNGSAFVGINGIVATGMQHGGIQDSIITLFSGVGMKIDSGSVANGSYNYSSNSRSWINGVNASLNGSATAGGVANQNTFAQVSLQNANYFAISLKGQASENNFNTSEVSGWTTPLADFGDGTSVCRDNILWSTTMEAGASSPVVTNQHGVDNACNMTLVHTEGALAGSGTPVTVNDVSTGTHFLLQGSSTGPGGIHTENTVPAVLWDQFGNLAVSGGTLANAGGAPNGIAIGAGKFICGANFASQCFIRLDNTGALGAKAFRAQTVLGDQGTACANGNLALSAGWGTTATATGVQGNGQTCQWTITASGTGQAANPTITWTLPTALPAATTVCTGQVSGGTQATPATINNSTLSATAPVFTYNGTPTAAATLVVTLRCGP